MLLRPDVLSAATGGESCTVPHSTSRFAALYFMALVIKSCRGIVNRSTRPCMYCHLSGKYFVLYVHPDRVLNLLVNRSDAFLTLAGYRRMHGGQSTWFCVAILLNLWCTLVAYITLQ